MKMYSPSSPASRAFTLHLRTRRGHTASSGSPGVTLREGMLAGGRQVPWVSVQDAPRYHRLLPHGRAPGWAGGSRQRLHSSACVGGQSLPPLRGQAAL